MIQEEFVKKAATELIEGVLRRADEILEEGTPILVRHVVDATSVYGENWHFAVNVKWVKDFGEYFMELAVYNFPNPYKIDIALLLALDRIFWIACTIPCLLTKLRLTSPVSKSVLRMPNVLCL